YLTTGARPRGLIVARIAAWGPMMVGFLMDVICTSWDEAATRDLSAVAAALRLRGARIMVAAALRGSALWQLLLAAGYRRAPLALWKVLRAYETPILDHGGLGRCDYATWADTDVL